MSEMEDVEETVRLLMMEHGGYAASILVLVQEARAVHGALDVPGALAVIRKYRGIDRLQPTHDYVTGEQFTRYWSS